MLVENPPVFSKSLFQILGVYPVWAEISENGGWNSEKVKHFFSKKESENLFEEGEPKERGIEKRLKQTFPVGRSQRAPPTQFRKLEI